jgi:cysteine desulfurase
MQGIQASSGSACSAGSLEPSHVLTAIGLERESAHSSLRLTFGENFNETDLQYILKVVPECVEKLRNISPLWKGGQK